MKFVKSLTDSVYLTSSVHATLTCMDARESPGTADKTVAVIGAGTIGASWAALFLAAGCDVRIYDPNPDATQHVHRQVDLAWPSLTAIGLAQGPIPKRLSFFAGPEDAVEGAAFVQESVPERLEAKHAIFRRIEPRLGSGAIVASSASGLLVRDMQESWHDPSRFVLGHPFNPPHLIPLVELLGNERTDPRTLDRAERFYRACGKVTIRLNKEVPGHVANRLQAALWREAIHLVLDGVASVADVDKAVASGPGLRWSVMGPHMLFSLGSGGSGIETFCERYRASFHDWWAGLGQPQLTPETVNVLAQGLAMAEGDRSFAELSGERDRKIVAVLKALVAEPPSPA